MSSEFGSTVNVLSEVIAEYHAFELLRQDTDGSYVYEDLETGRFFRVTVAELTEGEALAHLPWRGIDLAHTKL